MNNFKLLPRAEAIRYKLQECREHMQVINQLFEDSKLTSEEYNDMIDELCRKANDIQDEWLQAEKEGLCNFGMEGEEV